MTALQSILKVTVDKYQEWDQHFNEKESNGEDKGEEEGDSDGGGDDDKKTGKLVLKFR